MDQFIESWYKEQTPPQSVKSLLLQEYESKHTIITEEECETLWKRVCPDPNQTLEDVSISYQAFKSIRASLPVQFQRYLTAKTFMRMPKNKAGHVLGLQWMQYVLKTNGVHGIAHSLIEHSSNGTLLTKREFCQFMVTQFDTGLDLDLDLVEVSCAYLLQLLGKSAFPIQVRKLIYDQVLLDIYDQVNWFARDECVKVYDAYCDLNPTGTHLSRDQMLHMCNGVLTDRFLDALGHLPLTWPRFAAFQIAANNVHHPSAVRYLFNILDVDQCGYLTEIAVREYVKDVLVGANQLNPGCQFKLMDIVNEVLDMTGASSTRQITLQQLLRCKVGGTIIRLLVDVHGIAQYEQVLNATGS